MRFPSPHRRVRTGGPAGPPSRSACGPRRRRRVTPLLEGLEGRLAPAVVGNLFITGTTLVYSGTSADNEITVSAAHGSLTITDSAGTIASAVPGFAGSGTGSVTGAIPSFVTGVAINGNDGLDTVTIAAGGLALPNRALTITAESIVLLGNAATGGKSLTLSGAVSAQSAQPVTIATNGSTMAGSLTITGTLSALSAMGGSGLLSLDAATGSSAPGDISVSGAINVSGTNDSLLVSGNTVTLAAVRDDVGGTGSVTLRAADALAVSGALSAGSGGVVLDANTDNSGSEGVSVSGGITTRQGQVTVQTGGTGNIAIPSIDTGSTTAGTVVTLNAGGSIPEGLGTTTNVRATTLSASAGGPISLNTAVARINNLATSAPSATITVQNATAGPLTITQASTAAASIAISNDASLTVGSGSANKVLAGGTGSTLTLTATGTTSDVTLNDAKAPSGTIVVSAGRDILTPALTYPLTTAPAMTLTAVRNVGAPGAPAILNTEALTAASTGSASGSITIRNDMLAGEPNPDLTINAATVAATPTGATGNDITITTPQNLTVAGNVSTGSGNITLSTGVGVTALDGEFLLQSGAISATSALTGAGAVVLNSTQIFNQAAGTSITAGTGGVTIQNLSLTGIDAAINLAGQINASGSTSNVSVSGDYFAGPTNNSNSLEVSGQVSAGQDVILSGGTDDLIQVTGQVAAGRDVEVNAGEGPANGTPTGLTSVILFSGSINSGRNTVVNTNAATMLTMPPGSTIKAAGTVQLGSPLQADSINMSLGGNIDSTGAITLNGASGSGAAAINLSGTLVSGAAVAVTSNNTTSAAGTFQVSISGSITGSLITITGSTAAANTFDLGGQLNASGPGALGVITVTAAGDLFSSVFAIEGVLSATSLTHLVGGQAADTFVVTPSNGSPITFDDDGGTNSLVLQTPLTNILRAEPTFSAPITFNPASGLDAWTKGSGTWTVTPTVP